MKAEPIVLRLPAAAMPVERDFLNLGELRADGCSLRVNSRYLERDGRPWLPVMGEFHYARSPAAEWETELRKMKAGGVNIVASYVFWNHHEASPGVFDWTGRRDLRRFVELVARVGLDFYLRPGPWVHGEAHLGGFPDWLVAAGPVRCNDAAYLARVQRFWQEIGRQLHGLMWRDGGPVIGVQLENEYDRTGAGCGAGHIAELKRIALEAGLVVPVYTVTGWPTLDIPAREVVPVSGAYADGFWQGSAQALAPSGVFLFNTGRTIGEMGNVGGTPATGAIDKAHYPFFLAEAGGGMHMSYHRRPVIGTDDVAATALVQIGSGANLYGYYMYHGGVNPADGARVHETQASGYPNDVPVLGYDFRAPLGSYGRARASWGRLRLLHQFLAAFGEELAPMDAVLAEGAPADPADAGTLRVAARGAAGSGFLFVNHHVRHQVRPVLEGVRFEVDTAAGRLALPGQPCRVEAGSHFIWPVGAAIGGVLLRHATVQPLTRWCEGGAWTWVAFTLPGLPVELAFEAATLAHVDGLAGVAGACRQEADGVLTLQFEPEALPPRLPLRLTDAAGRVHTLLLLRRDEAERCQRVSLLGRERLALCAEPMWVDGDALVVEGPADGLAEVVLWPADDLLAERAPQDGFATFGAAAARAHGACVHWQVVEDRQQLPPVRLGPRIAWRDRAVPLAPDDAEYAAHAQRIALSLQDVPTDGARVLLTLDYVGDAARLYADGVLVDDQFADGQPWCVGLDRHRDPAPEGGWPRLELQILPARADLPVFVEDDARQRWARAEACGRRAELLAARLDVVRARRIEPCLNPGD